jgi:hypothetical protein
MHRRTTMVFHIQTTDMSVIAQECMGLEVTEWMRGCSVHFKTCKSLEETWMWLSVSTRPPTKNDCGLGPVAVSVDTSLGIHRHQMVTSTLRYNFQHVMRTEIAILRSSLCTYDLSSIGLPTLGMTHFCTCFRQAITFPVITQITYNASRMWYQPQKMLSSASEWNRYVETWYYRTEHEMNVFNYCIQIVSILDTALEMWHCIRIPRIKHYQFSQIVRLHLGRYSV